VTFECASCSGHGAFASGAPCRACRGQGRKLCDLCGHDPASVIVADERLLICRSCASAEHAEAERCPACGDRCHCAYCGEPCARPCVGPEHEYQIGDN
jgi:hypothetical protein